MGKIKVCVRRIKVLNNKTKGKIYLDDRFTGYLYKLTNSEFLSNTYLSILQQKCCVPAFSLKDAFNEDPARILVYNEHGEREIETSPVVSYNIDGKAATVETLNSQYEIVLQD